MEPVPNPEAKAYFDTLTPQRVNGHNFDPAFQQGAELRRLNAVNEGLREHIALLETELQRRAGQIGVACLKHDLTHSLACGHCLDEARAALSVAMDAMEDRRNYADGWEWKYGAIWTREDNIVRAALDPSFKP